MILPVLCLAIALAPNLVCLTEMLSQAKSRSPQQVQRPQNPRTDYSQFSHSTHIGKEKLSCDSCHKFPTKNWKDVRKGDAAFQDVAEFPEHSSCLNCHRQQFFARERPQPRICSNCHVNVTPRETSRFLFPSLGDVSDSSRQRRDTISEFVVSFPHDKHIDVVGFNLDSQARTRFVRVTWQQKSANSSEPKSCPICHQTYQRQGNSAEEYVTKPPKNLGDDFWLKKGSFKTVPNSHAACFTCHNVEVGIEPAPSNCAGCHKLAAPRSILAPDFDPKLTATIGVTDKTILHLWSRRAASGTFRHEGGDHPNISCPTCHSIPTMNTTDPKTLIVSVRSCGGAEGCHVTATTDDGGILNYEIDKRKTSQDFVCTKCHISFGKKAVPESHVKAIQALKKP